MRRLFEATGMPVGAGMEEALRRMESGEDPEKIEEEMGDVMEDPLAPKEGVSLRATGPGRRSGACAGGSCRPASIPSSTRCRVREHAMDPAFREFLAGELTQIQEQGLFKEEWPLLGPQGAEIRVSRAARARAQLLREQLPGPLGPSRADRRRPPLPGRVGLRHVERALHLRHPGPPPGAGASRRAVPGHGGCDPLRRLLRRERRGLRAPARPRRRDRGRQAEPRLDHRRGAPLQGQALPLRARGHGRPRGEARGGGRARASA